MLTPLNLYTCKVYASGGLVGSFLAAAADNVQARAIAKEWAIEQRLATTNIIVTRNPEPRGVFGFAA